MRLLHAKDLTFHEPPPDKIPKYAILSHRWMDGEVLYHEILTEAGNKKAGFEKIKKCGQTALAQGIDYIWVDTCCIDKSSSAELSEAINSMSRWYADAKICYAYLADVSLHKNYSDEDAEALPESLRQSDWFKRGWTLQELIFPKQLLFYTQHWDRIASRRKISKALSDITGISSELLSASRTDIDSFSVAEKMSWASKRVTTRPEDLAYCLLGLFEVNMPLLYGEGDLRAFKRLQEAIIRKSDDHSILAW
ncbi:HET-domain-containing protein, partial [Hyaloscypha variabilis F]